MIEFNSGLGGRTEDFGRQAVDAMGELDTNTWIEASRSYVRLRRRYWRCWLGMPASLVVLVALIPVFGHTLKNPYVRGALFSLLIVAWCACWLGCAVTWFALMGLVVPGAENGSSYRGGVAGQAIGASIAISISVRLQ